MRTSIFIIGFMMALAIAPKTAAQGQWFYPISDYTRRESFKGFGQYFDLAFYKGRETLFPTQFTGFHSGIDLEATQAETDAVVPIYAVADGSITFAGSVSGYGGLILERLDNENHTALYGHVTTDQVKTGQAVKAGAQIAILGKGYSSETAGERKHLHFAIYKGTDKYVAGYEKLESNLNARFENPSTFLQTKGAKDVNQQQSATPRMTEATTSPTATPQPAKENPGFFSRIISWFKNLF